MDYDVLKEISKKHLGNLEILADHLGIGKSALSNWASNGVPQKYHLKILNLLKPDENDRNKLFGLSPLQVFFRSRGKDKSKDDEFLKRVKDFSRIYMNLHEVRDLNSSDLVYLNNDLNVNQVAKWVSRFLKISDDQPVSLSKIYEKLLNENIVVNFISLKDHNLYSNMYTSSSLKEAAFTIKKANQYHIFIDSDVSIHSASFHMIHEITHILCDHNEDMINDEIENFCDSVASQILYPENYLKDLYSIYFEKKELNNELYSKIKETTNQYCEEFTCSPAGIAIALKKIYPNKKDYEIFKVLFSLSKYYVGSIRSMVFKDVDFKSANSLSQFLSSSVVNRDYCHFYRSIYNWIIEERISYRVLSIILNIDVLEAKEVLSILYSQKLENGKPDYEF